MTRQFFAFAAAIGLLALLGAPDAQAVELPVRKAARWEMEVVRKAGTRPEMTRQQCTDASTDKQMRTSLVPGKETCSKQDVAQTASGYASDSVCSVGSMTITSHAEIT